MFSEVLTKFLLTSLRSITMSVVTLMGNMMYHSKAFITIKFLV